MVIEAKITELSGGNNFILHFNAENANWQIKKKRQWPLCDPAGTRTQDPPD